ncbi:FAD-dependent monooxygenase [Taibaiella lutea]|uniref:FAD-dependent monooxygenase n=1 Tax=Taibaiella lutea TaxID=2608001 RepID=A0A5M6CKR1_9BACT|nr:tryptophan 7-halogenase [Taibaiella lutea]KAA5533719.1 FAD-dependent monooxygenase [Taibaiella lutea]
MNHNFLSEADITIVGGGIAGCTLAMALSATYKVVLIDKLPEPVERVGECLAPAARRILRKLDLLDDIVQQNSTDNLYLPNPGTKSYWGSEMLHVVDNLRNPDGPGWHLNRNAFEAHLRKKTSESGVQCYWGVKLYKSHYENARWRLSLQSTTTDNEPFDIVSKFVVDASGRSSVFAKQLKIARMHSDKLIAHWATMPDREENRMSTISSAETGWWYSAPLPDNKRVMAMHTDPDLLDPAALKDAGWFTEAAKANKEMAAIMNAVEGNVDYCGVVTANSTRLNQVAGKQWAAVGDAAMSFDPLSSQGMFNAMAGALQLAELLLKQTSLDNPEKTEQIQAEYTIQMDNIWNRYIQHKNLFYTQEQRWKDATFWKRRS